MRVLGEMRGKRSANVPRLSDCGGRAGLNRGLLAAILRLLLRRIARMKIWRTALAAVWIYCQITAAYAAKSPFASSESRSSGSAAGLSLDGAAVDPLSGITNKGVVLIFLSHECPISNRYAPEIRRLNAKFAPRGVKFWLVYPNADETVKAITQHTNDYRLNCDVLRDPRHVLVKRAKATVTPEAAVFLNDGRLVYHGRIDNRYVVLGKERPEATEHDLDAFLQAVVDGKPLPTAAKPAVGCYIAER